MSSNSDSTVNTLDENSNGMVLTINISDIIKGFLKFWWICLLFALIFGGYQFYRYKICFIPQYSVSATFTVSTQTQKSVVGYSSYEYYYSQSRANELADTFPVILNTDMMKMAMKEELGKDSIPASLSMSAVSGTNIFTIQSIGIDPQMTYDTLNAAIRCYPEIAKYVVGNIKIKIISEPEIPKIPTNTSNYIKQTFIGILAGIALGIMWILSYAVFRKTIRSENDVRKDLKTDVLGILPVVVFKRYTEEINRSVLITNNMVSNHYKEEIKVLRNTILHKISDHKVLMITSTAPGEGKTTIATNIAISIAQSDKKVLIIDGDMRNPSVYYGIFREEAPEGEGDWSIVSSETSGIDILTFNINPKDVFKMMLPEKLSSIIEPLREQYDIIVIDTPPCGLISDALTFAQIADSVIFVILHDAVRISKICNTVDMLNYTDIEFLGCVINGTSSGITSGYGYNKYTYGKYGYGSRYNYGKYGYSKYGYGYGESSDNHNHRLRKDKHGDT